MEMFETLTKCPGCGHEAKRVYLSAAAFTKCGACLHIYRLTAETLENLARVALLNLPTSTAVRVLLDTRDQMIAQGAGPATLAALRVSPDAARAFVLQVARLTKDGEETPEHPDGFDMPSDDAVETLAALVNEARDLTEDLTDPSAHVARVEPVGAMGEAAPMEPMLAEALTPELRTLHAVCDQLRAEGLNVSIEYPGHIETPDYAPDGGVWCIGTANEAWGGDVATNDGAGGNVFVTDVPSTSTDAHAIAAAILSALREYCRTCGESETLDADDLCHDCARTERAALRSRGER